MNKTCGTCQYCILDLEEEFWTGYICTKSMHEGLPVDPDDEACNEYEFGD